MFQIPLFVVGIFVQLLGLLFSIIIAVPFYIFLFTNSKRQTLFDLVVRRAVIDTKAEKKSVKIYTIPLWSMASIYLVGITVLGMMFSNFMSENSKEWIASGMPVVGQIVVADRDIAEGETIGPLDVVECPVPPDIVTSGSFVCSNPVIGSKTARPIPRGDWFIVGTLEDGSAILKKQLELLQQNKNNPSAVCNHDSSKARKKIVHRLKGKDLFLRVVHDIPEGEVIKAEDIAVESLDEDKVPVDSLMCRSKYSAVGKCTKRGITKGQMLSSYDINYRKLVSDRACFAKTTIKAGTAISGNQIEYKTITAEECPSSAVVVKEVILNKKALHDIKEGDILRSVDVLDEFQIQ